MIAQPVTEFLGAQWKDGAEDMLVGRLLTLELVPLNEGCPFGVVVRVDAKSQSIDLVLLHGGQEKQPREAVIGRATLRFRDCRGSVTKIGLGLRLRLLFNGFPSVSDKLVSQSLATGRKSPQETRRCTSTGSEDVNEE